jgi:pyridinium-3,5-bisthiocarboxylic acid mononucleotide nickel chelatase
MRTLYLDCASGISGDMTLGALLDLGVDPGPVMAGLESMGVTGWHATAKKAMKGPLAGTAFRVEVDEAASGGDRSLPDIEALIQKARISEGARALALRAFRLLAQAEATIHGTTIDQVHFHEVGAADSIVDIVGSAIAMDALAPDRIVFSPISMSRGHVRCRHGLIPLPAPAALELAKGLPIRRPPAPTMREMATPTGLALAKAFATDFGEMPDGVVSAIGYGLGHTEFPWPNVLRAVLVEEASQLLTDVVALLEANLDDMTGEAMAHALERVLEAGALDAWLAPIHMKKGRPGFIFSVLCAPQDEQRLAALILRETTTLGIRRSRSERFILPREVRVVETRFGPIRCKVSQGVPPRVKPEFEDCRRAAAESGETLLAVTEEIRCKALETLDKTRSQ